MMIALVLLLALGGTSQAPAREPGEFRVPANRADSPAGTLTLRYVRIQSTAAEPGAPIVLLAGGPGDSGIRVVSTMPAAILEELLAIADVIAFDQRGTGVSDPAKPLCPPGELLPRDRPFDPEATREVLKNRLATCLEGTAARGIDVRGLTTDESADDLAALAATLGVKKLMLMGVSYGTHLALATARRHPGLVDRMALAGVEGPDDTLKLPSRVEQILEAIAASRRPTLVSEIRQLRTRLAAEPARYTFPTGRTIVLGEWDLQRWVADALDSEAEMDAMMAAVPQLLDQDYTVLGRWALTYRVPRALNLMNLVMDCASYASDDRLDRITSEAKTAVLGDAINFPLPDLCGLPGLPRSPDSYREPVRSNLPALLISGSLDGRTPPANAAAVAETMPNARTMVIEGASHDLLRRPQTMKAIMAFLRQSRREPGAAVPSTRASGS